jgi:general secretion pathway protein D
MKTWLTLLLATCALSSAHAQSAPPRTPTVRTVTPRSGLPVILPANPKLNRVLTVSLPAGVSLKTALLSITRASGLNLLERDLPNVPVTLNVKGQSTRAALEQLLSLYADQVGARLVGDTLIVAPTAVINNILNPPVSTRETIPGTITEDDARRLSVLTGAMVVPLRDATLVSGTPEQVEEIRRLLAAGIARPSTPSTEVAPTAAPAPMAEAPSAPPESSTPALPTLVSASVPLGQADPELTRATVLALHDVKMVSAYGRAYLQATTPAALDAAKATITQLQSDAGNVPPAAPALTAPAPPASPALPVRRTITTILAAELVTRLAQSVSETLRVTPLDPGTYVVRGLEDDVQAFEALHNQAQTREAMRVNVVYPNVPGSAEAALRDLLPTVGLRTLGGALEVRGTPQEQVRASAYLAALARSLPPVSASAAAPEVEELLTLRVALANAAPATVVAQLVTLYAQAGAGTSAGSTAAPSGSNPGTASSAPSGSSTGTASSAPAGGQLISGVRVVADDRTRSVVLYGPAQVVARLQRTVTDLDTRVPDVRMALRIEQLSDSNGSELGLNWKVGVGGFSIAQQNGSLSAGFTPGLSAPSIEATLNAARSQGRANTLLDTTFVAQDGRPSVFRNGGQLLLPITNTTTTDGNTSTSQTRETYDYGLNVSLTPRVAPDGRVELQLQLEIGQTPRAGVQNSIVVEKQVLTTIATVTPGETLVLGGVITAEDSQDRRGVPVLSEIPVLGALFGQRQASRGGSLLLITLSAANREDARAPVPPSSGGAGLTRITIPGNGR